MELRDSIREILSDKKTKTDGLHVKYIASHILNNSRTLFPDENDPTFEVLKQRINGILLYDINSKNSEFERVTNPKTNKYRKGVYKLKKRRGRKKGK
ncbi:MAG: hypothetical protein PHN68_06955 [Prolixibacteraceae bacterium]|jgi:hypothetical protein|nr:hypothetical protein [Prolixibacteraceae bacterium]MDD4756442.1 hypothetical protein [Prolixibacteraceae bacterium]NLO01818.1 hypothetical protein [Bacteroidales bacterium]